MVTFLVKLDGRLGNNLFQLAFALGYAARYPTASFVLSFLERWTHSHHGQAYSSFFNGINVISIMTSTLPAIRERREDVGHYIDYPNITSTCCFHGYFQSEKYFSHIADTIRRRFGPPDTIRNELMTKYPDLSHGMFLHIRRGDYTHYAQVAVDLSRYYARAIALAPSTVKWFVCSDDLPWCREQSWIQALNPIFVDESDERTLWLMSLCTEGGVCANSTFSWWGAWLNPSSTKRIYFPDTYYTVSDLRTDDLVPDGWITLPVL